MHKPVQAIEVRIWGKTVGAVALAPNLGYYAFEYDSRFVKSGIEHWLLKFDGMSADRELGGSQDYGRIEYVYYRMACAAGIAMSPCRLLEENGRAHLASGPGSISWR